MMPPNDITPEQDNPIPGPGPYTDRTVRLATEYLAHVVEQCLGCRHGKTALYWALVSTIAKHANKIPDPE